jgi:sirohydrochlorin cobaltochelatase
MTQRIVLAMHGAPPLDYPRAELAEFFRLHSSIEHSSAEQRATLEARYAELDRKIRAWPRTAQNDPFFAGASALAEAIARAAGSEVIMGFNEFCAPALDEALDLAAGQGAGRVVVVTPMMTRGGEHSEKEIPAAVRAAQQRHPGVEIRYAWPLDLEAIAQFLAEQVRKF